jgi:hypothetical protein
MRPTLMSLMPCLADSTITLGNVSAHWVPEDNDTAEEA